MQNREIIPCPYCNHTEYIEWAKDNGFTAVKCKECGIVYVNPRPILSLVNDAVKTGTHSAEANSKNVVTKRIDSKVEQYRRIFADMYDDVWESKKDISWLDVGAGFGEIIEAISMLSTKASNIQGLEPMKPKAEAAIKRGLKIHEKYLNELDDKFDFISVINVFSHIPDFHSFLKDAKKVLKESGEIFIETGDTANLKRSSVPGEIDLPDHLVFGAEKHIIGYLNQAGFEVIKIRKERIDTLLEFTKDIVKKIIGRPIILRLPYTSKYRTIFIRAKIHPNSN
jgi:ubiquinone/menaquinone biosynthesis C-methylase UbiE